jgi:acetyl/propionyl-CoA carboxylase alpha subunit
VHRPPVGSNPWAAIDAFTPNLPATVQMSVQLRGRQHAITVESQPQERLSVVIDDTPFSVTDVLRTGDRIVATLDDLRLQARVCVYEIHVHVWLEGDHYDFVHEDPRSKEFSASSTGGGLTTPLPGVVVAVKVVEGQSVAAGEVLMVIEAMKMEHAITAPHAGTVQTLHFAQGDRVAEGSALLELTPAAGD